MDWNCDDRDETVVPYHRERTPVEQAELAHDEWPEAFERRDHLRQPLREGAELEIEGQRVPVRLENQSDRGVFLRSEWEIRPGQRVRLCRVEDGPRRAVIVHRRPVPRSLTGMGHEGIGLLFLDDTAA